MALAAAGAALAACTADAPRPEESGTAAQAVTGGWESVKLPWGKGRGEAGLRPAAPELLAEGPSSVAVAPSGEVLVLDRLNERVIAIGAGGAITTLASVPRDAEHIAAGPGGVIAAWSPLRATVWLTGRDGRALGEIAVPRELREIARIDVGISHRVAAVSALQETLQLGSPRAPLDLAAALRTRREGAAFLADGRGVAARRAESGGGELFAYRSVKPGDDAKPEIAWTFPIAGPVAAVRVIGASGKALCARVERVTQDTTIAVEREALCVEVGTGKVLLQRALGRPGVAPLHEDVAVGGDPAVIAFAVAEEDGLRVERIPLESSPTGPLAASKGVSR